MEGCEVALPRGLAQLRVRLRLLDVIFDMVNEEAQEKARSLSNDGDYESEGIVLEEVHPELAHARFHWLEADRVYRRGLADNLLNHLPRNASLVLVKGSSSEFRSHVEDLIDFAVDSFMHDHGGEFEKLEKTQRELWEQVSKAMDDELEGAH